MIMVIAAVILITVFFGLYQILSLNEDVKQISRKYMLTINAMLNGLGYDQIKVGCLQDWDSSRNNIDNMIKEQRGHIVSDLKANNYIPEKRLVHKIGRLNGLTGGKFNKVSDIVNSVKSGKISNRYGEASLLKEIGEDLQHQRRVMSPAAQQKIHADAVPTR